ncbi:hypothetical protein [Isoptericola croceus]|uniref:hypothetical protein n=1 Tax=Isoptericola croceus TaxID=3031406 RepID=UPI0023F91610|nr:hypothetical protein [Isoptericola croceus]
MLGRTSRVDRVVAELESRRPARKPDPDPHGRRARRTIVRLARWEWTVVCAFLATLAIAATG